MAAVFKFPGYSSEEAANTPWADEPICVSMGSVQNYRAAVGTSYAPELIVRVGEPEDNAPMDHVPRPELDAKLEAIEARMDARLARIEAAAEGIQRDVDKMGNLKQQVWGAALTIILAVVGVVIGIQQMTVSTFQAASQQPTTSPVIIQMPQGAVSAQPPAAEPSK